MLISPVRRYLIAQQRQDLGTKASALCSCIFRVSDSQGGKIQNISLTSDPIAEAGTVWGNNTDRFCSEINLFHGPDKRIL
jgi:hypothetical protein